MARIKRAVAAKKKRRTVMHRAKGYYGAASRTYKHAKEQVQHSLGDRTKAIGKLDLGLSDFSFAAQRSDPSVKLEPQFLVGDVAGWDLA